MEKEKTTLLVDGEVLKQHILNSGEKHTPQAVLQYLHHMVSEIKQQFPNLDVRVNYYGVRAADDAKMPISGNLYPDIDIKKKMRFAKLPDAELKTFWSRMYYPYEYAWVMKPESYEKKTLSDADFSLNEQPKGLLTQLVDEMAEKAVAHRDSCLFVYGDPENMTYALETTNGLDMPVNEIFLDHKRPYIAEITKSREPSVVDKTTLNEVSESLRQPWAKDETLNGCLSLLRGALSGSDQEVFLMLDIGCVRRYLFSHGRRMSLQNVQTLLDQVQKALPEKPTKTIFYHGVLCDMKEKKVGKEVKEECSIEFQFDKKLFESMPNVKFSLGKTQPDKLFPVILKRNKWHVPNEAREPEDFITNFRQYDVDDRIAYDMALARLNPMVRRVFLLSLDGDFAHSVEMAKLAGMQVSLVQLEGTGQSLSARLEREVDDRIPVSVNLDELIKSKDERRLVHAQNEEEKRNRCKQEQKGRKLQARLDAEDEEESLAGFRIAKPSKSERWGRRCKKRKYEARKIISKRRGQYE